MIRKSSPSQRCPECDEPIDSPSINIQEGVALCKGCGRLSRLSELIWSSRSIQEIFEQPPASCSIEELGRSVVIRASLRSIAGFLGSTAIALFWNGIVSIFALHALAGLCANLFGPLPDWFPAPGLKDGVPEMNGESMTLGMTLFLCVFLVPFVTVGTGMISYAITYWIGKVVLVIDELESYVAIQVGFFQWKQRFDASKVRDIIFHNQECQSDEGNKKHLEIVADRTIKFGSLMQQDQLEWFRVALKEIVSTPDKRHCESIPNLPWLHR